MKLINLESCAFGYLDGISYGDGRNWGPEAIIRDFNTRRNNELKPYPNRGIIMFGDNILDGEYSMGKRLAVFIEKNKLGTVFVSPAAMCHHHPERSSASVAAFVWAPDYAAITAYLNPPKPHPQAAAAPQHPQPQPKEG